MFWGFCQDNFGRRKTYIITGLLTFIFAFSICFTQDYTQFIILRVLFGWAANGMGSYTLPLELGKFGKALFLTDFHGLCRKSLEILRYLIDSNEIREKPKTLFFTKLRFL